MGCLPGINHVSWYCGGMLGVVAPRMGRSTSLRTCQLSVHQRRRGMSAYWRCQTVFDHESYPRSLCKSRLLKRERYCLPAVATWDRAYATCSQIPNPWNHPIKKTFKLNSLHHYTSSPSPLLLASSQTRTAHNCTFVASNLLMRPRQSFTPPITREYTTQHGPTSQWRRANRSTVTYMVAIAIAVVGLSYAAVPLYRLFCQASGYGGTVVVVDPGEKVEKMKPIRERILTIRFNADTSAGMEWKFKPQQREIKVVPGETALAFYTARNPTDRPVTGISTYNVIPFEAGLYFNKIQCFCFEEQRLNPKEEVDMPVFFYIDPDFNDDPAMAKVDTITLSYTFFESREGDFINIPVPSRQT